MTPPATPTSIMAQRLIGQLLTHLKSMDVSLTRLVELSQTPRENLFAAGTITFGGTVGVTPASCTIAPPIGLPPGTVLGANPHRRGLNIQNLSAAAGPNLTLGLGLTSPQSGSGLVILPGQTWNGLVSGAVWTGSVTVVASAAACLFAGLEMLGRNETPRRRGANIPL